MHSLLVLAHDWRFECIHFDLRSNAVIITCEFTRVGLEKAWDAEYRLIEIKRDTSTPTLTSRLRLTFEYDHLGRRIRKTYYAHNGTTWVEQTDTVFLYDEWNLMGELDANNSNAKLRTYVWGLDLSGSNQGAGGVGGLLKATEYTSGTTHHFAAYDGNGNVAALIDGSTAAKTARYEYGLFAEAIRTTGLLGKKNPLRFNTKYTDDETALVYYGFRYYNPRTGKWLSRDPIGEKGGGNLDAFVRNNPITQIRREFYEFGVKSGPNRGFAPKMFAAVDHFS